MRFLSNLLIAFFLLISSAKSQNTQDWLSGYFSHNDSISFLFSESIYQISPSGVVVTGAFRGWSQDLKDSSFHLQKTSPKEWKLTLANPKFQKVKPGMPFKFRTSEGKWLSPPKEAPNLDGGNLAFMKGFEPLNITAGLNKDANIEVSFTGLTKDQNFTPNLQEFLLQDAFGNAIKLGKMQNNNTPNAKPNTASFILKTE